MKHSNIYKQSDECLLEDMDGELLLFNPASAVTLHLNQASVMVWNLCDGRRTIAQIIEELQAAFPEQSDQISDDVESVITDLDQRKVLQLVDQSETEK